MTLFMADDGGAGYRRWAAYFGIVFALHAAPILAIAWWLGPLPSTPPSVPSAIMVDLGPTPSETRAPPTEIPPGPEVKRVTVRPRTAAPRPKSHIARTATVGPAQSDQRPLREGSSAEAVTHEATVPPAAPATAAKASAPSAPSPSNAAPTWQGLVLGCLERFKRYPLDAQSRHQQGIAYLRFTMDRDGNVLAARIEKSSGYQTLDQETLDLIRRALPLPKPPPEVAGDRLELVVPIEFFLSDARQ